MLSLWFLVSYVAGKHGVLRFCVLSRQFSLVCDVRQCGSCVVVVDIKLWIWSVVGCVRESRVM